MKNHQTRGRFYISLENSFTMFYHQNSGKNSWHCAACWAPNGFSKWAWPQLTAVQSTGLPWLTMFCWVRAFVGLTANPTSKQHVLYENVVTYGKKYHQQGMSVRQGVNKSPITITSKTNISRSSFLPFTQSDRTARRNCGSSEALLWQFKHRGEPRKTGRLDPIQQKWINFWISTVPYLFVWLHHVLGTHGTTYSQYWVC